MNEVKSPKKPMMYYYAIVILMIWRSTSWQCPG